MRRIGTGRDLVGWGLAGRRSHLDRPDRLERRRTVVVRRIETFFLRVGIGGLDVALMSYVK